MHIPHLHGDEGNDKLSIGIMDYSEAPNAIAANLSWGMVSGEGTGRNLSLVQSAYASTDYDDKILGSWRRERLDGLGGNDELSGYAGADIMDGGHGDDTVSGVPARTNWKRGSVPTASAETATTRFRVRTSIPMAITHPAQIISTGAMERTPSCSSTVSGSTSRLVPPTSFPRPRGKRTRSLSSRTSRPASSRMCSWGTTTQTSSVPEQATTISMDGTAPMTSMAGPEIFLGERREQHQLLSRASYCKVDNL